MSSFPCSLCSTCSNFVPPSLVIISIVLVSFFLLFWELGTFFYSVTINDAFKCLHLDPHQAPAFPAVTVTWPWWPSSISLTIFLNLAFDQGFLDYWPKQTEYFVMATISTSPPAGDAAEPSQLPVTSMPLGPATSQSEDFATSGPAKPRRGLPPANPAPAKPRHHRWPCGRPPDCFASYIDLPVDPLNCIYFAVLCSFFENEHLLKELHFHEHARDGPSPEASLSL